VGEGGVRVHVRCQVLALGMGRWGGVGGHPVSGEGKARAYLCI
jgi:hypothetical protein